MNRIYISDTICAIATSAGGGGSISVIRVSGENSLPVAAKVFRPSPKKFESHKLYYGHVCDDGENIDEVLVFYMKAPRSYTCEDVIEIQCHGGPRSAGRILGILLKNGVRLAEQGEFTKRAFLNGRIDLSQAEAVLDIINAKTDLSHQAAVNRLKGNLSDRIKECRNIILGIIANIEANIDYPENDIEELSVRDIRSTTEELIGSISSLIKTAETGKIIHEGIETVILGKPNVGKSSVMNALLREERAIVTGIPGTTRDILQEYININNIPLKIVDTAGIRKTSDEIERIGVGLSRRYAETADLILMVIDRAQEMDEIDFELLKYADNKKVIVLVNKIDLNLKIDYNKLYSYIDKSSIIEISAKNNIGLDELSKKLTEMFFSGEIDYKTDITISNMRHKSALMKAFESLNNVIETIDNGFSQDFMSIDLTDAYNYLGEITGDSLDEDIIDKIFSEFCLGK